MKKIRGMIERGMDVDVVICKPEPPEQGGWCGNGYGGLDSGRMDDGWWIVERKRE
jgi:hypothetical protein